MTYLSHKAFFDSIDRIAPPNPGIKHLARPTPSRSESEVFQTFAQENSKKSKSCSSNMYWYWPPVVGKMEKF